MAAAPTIADLGQRVKAKYPDYADLDDAEVGRRVKVKFPGAYDDFTDVAAPAVETPGLGARLVQGAEEALGAATTPIPYAAMEAVGVRSPYTLAEAAEGIGAELTQPLKDTPLRAVQPVAEFLARWGGKNVGRVLEFGASPLGAVLTAVHLGQFGAKPKAALHSLPGRVATGAGFTASMVPHARASISQAIEEGSPAAIATAVLDTGFALLPAAGVAATLPAAGRLGRLRRLAPVEEPKAEAPAKVEPTPVVEAPLPAPAPRRITAEEVVTATEGRRALLPAIRATETRERQTAARKAKLLQERAAEEEAGRPILERTLEETEARPAKTLQQALEERKAEAAARKAKLAPPVEAPPEVPAAGPEKAVVKPEEGGAAPRVSPVPKAPSVTPVAKARTLGAISEVSPPAAKVAPPFNPEGMKTEVHTTAGRKVNVVYDVAEADALTSSFDAGYPAEFQPRDTSRKGSRQRIEQRKGDLNPELMGESKLAADGAPITLADGTVITRNHGLQALRELYQARSGRALGYKEWLKENAARFGLDPARVAGMKAPVLRRVVTDALKPAEIERFAQEANVSSAARMSDAELAAMLAKRATGRVMDAFTPSESGSPNPEFVRELIRELPVEEQQAFMDAKGEVSQTGARIVRNVVFAKAYPDTKAVERMAEREHPTLKNVTNGMLAAAPDVARFQEAAARGERFNLGIEREITDAAAVMDKLTTEGSTVEMWLNQQEMFGRDPVTRKLVEVFTEQRRSGKRIGGVLREYTRVAEEAGDPRQGELLGGRVAPPKIAVLEEAYRRTQERWAAEKRPIEDLEAEAKARIEARGKAKLGDILREESGTFDPQALADYAVVGAAKIARGAKEFSAWSKEMVEEFGETVRPHLLRIYARAKDYEAQGGLFGEVRQAEARTTAQAAEAQLTGARLTAQFRAPITRAEQKLKKAPPPPQASLFEAAEEQFGPKRAQAGQKSFWDDETGTFDPAAVARWWRESVFADIGESVRPELSRVRRAGGGAGKALGDMLYRAAENGELDAGENIVRLMDAGLNKLTAAEGANLVDALEGRGRVTSPKVQTVFDAARAMTDKIRDQAIALGIEERSGQGDLFFGGRTNYFPHLIRSPKVLTRSGAVRRDVLKNLEHIGAAASPGEARLMLDEWIDYAQNPLHAGPMRTVEYLVRKGFAANQAVALDQLRRARTHVKEYGSLENRREVNLPFWDPDPRRVLPTHGSSAAQRLAQIEEFGQSSEVVAVELLRIQEAGGNAREVGAAVDRIIGKVFEGNTPEERISRFVASAQIVKLTLAALPNVTQGSLLGWLATDLPSVARGIGALFTRHGRRFAVESGAGLESVLREATREMGGAEWTKTYLKVCGFTPTEVGNRITASNAGAFFARRTFDQLRNSRSALRPRGDPGARGLLADLGVDVDAALGRGALTPLDLRRAGKRVSDRTQFRNRPQNIPRVASHWFGRMWWVFRNYNYQSLRLTWDASVGEFKAGRPKRAIRNIMLMTILFPAVGDQIRAVRDTILGRKREKESLVERYLWGAANVSTFGQIVDIMRSSNIGAGVEAVAGTAAASAGRLLNAAFQPAKTPGGAVKRLGRQVVKEGPFGSVLAARVLPKPKRTARPVLP